ncbi:class I adenylate-forming enzyme family protein [Pseudooctadecabacter jejudonensis]|uniref:Long-chain-fatty-acid--CoA ligase n=1 Tax=Pseudooctadecabacter jejudonensis TaxID=1391910 RepID=A0A1Y5RFR7_9RHOB|nr:class I adenylate-forming enzyme family protein [Pseudooctadecabacter jejudonensis]SLN16516.1 Long-chain-fatty-acid--CoA ligase [Pseudooctadecabacter jejudonensis]
MFLSPVPAPFNMAAHVLARAGAQPDKVALAILGPARAERWSYARLEAAVRGAATGLLQTGLCAGDRVLLRLGNTPDFPIAFLACLAVDLIPVPTSAQLTSPETTALAATLAPAAIIGGADIALPDHPAPVINTDTLRGFHALAPAPYTMGDPNRAGYIIFTSGTSGRPRGVVHAHRAIWARGSMFDGWYGLTDTDRVLHAGAFNWTYTLGTGLMDPWTQGATALIPAADTKPAMLPLLMKRHDATIFAAAPGVYRHLLKSPMPPLPKLRHGLSAGEKLPQTTRDAWEAATGTPIYEAYGMSECSTFLSGSPSTPAEAGTLGQPQPGRRVALVEGGSLADTGEIAVHRDDPGLMLHYLDAPEETAQRFAGDWFLTGDRATRTAGGHIRYDGRIDDMMNAGGYRVSPIEVEAALAQHPAISEVAAVELRVKSDASVIAAFYVSDDVIGEDELAAFSARYLARYKAPRLFTRVDALPRGANNKLLRRQLRQDWNARHGQT